MDRLFAVRFRACHMRGVVATRGPGVFSQRNLGRETGVDAMASSDGRHGLMTQMKPASLFVEQPDKAWRVKRISFIAADFMRELFGVIHVSERADGTCHVIDGRIRVAAVLARGEGDIPVATVLWKGLTESDEVELLEWVNNPNPNQPLPAWAVPVRGE